MGTVAHVLRRYDETRVKAFGWCDELAWPAKMLLAFDVAALTGLLAQMRLVLPFTPVPVTGQVFGVLLAGAVLGGGWGALSMAMYVGLGAGGACWFAEFTGGMGILAGVTGGYLVGFVPAAALVGLATKHSSIARRFWAQCLLMLIGVAVIYLFGAAWLSRVLHTGMRDTLLLGVLPFVAVDVGKALLAAAIACAVLPRRR